MHALQRLSPAEERIALFPVRAPSPEAMFNHQANELLRLGFCSSEEIERAEKYVSQLVDPFLFIPGRKEDVMSVVSGRGERYSRNDIAGPTRDVEPAPEGPYFVTGYDEQWCNGEPLSAEDCLSVCKASRRSLLTVRELAYRLYYFPKEIRETQFAAAGSIVEREKGNPHVPVFFLPERTLLLSSFTRTHRTKFTLFPSCALRVPVGP